MSVVKIICKISKSCSTIEINVCRDFCSIWMEWYGQSDTTRGEFIREQFFRYIHVYPWPLTIQNRSILSSELVAWLVMHLKGTCHPNRDEIMTQLSFRSSYLTVQKKTVSGARGWTKWKIKFNNKKLIMHPYF